MYITNLLYICSVKSNELKMKWSELKKKAVEHGFEFRKHGGKHDEYVNPITGAKIQIERHWSQEIRPGLLKRLKQIIGF